MAGPTMKKLAGSTRENLYPNFRGCCSVGFSKFPANLVFLLVEFTV